jgi:hypothetical protein
MEGSIMRIKFKSTQGGKEGFQINQEYEMDEKSARHWISVNAAVEVTGRSARQATPNHDTPANAPAKT